MLKTQKPLSLSAKEEGSIQSAKEPLSNETNKGSAVKK